MFVAVHESRDILHTGPRAEDAEAPHLLEDRDGVFTHDAPHDYGYMSDPPLFHRPLKGRDKGNGIPVGDPIADEIHVLLQSGISHPRRLRVSQGDDLHASVSQALGHHVVTCGVTRGIVGQEEAQLFIFQS